MKKVSSSIEERSGISPPLFRTLVVVTAIVPLILLVAPAAASQLASQLKLSSSQVGTYFFFELGAFSLGTLPSYFWLHRIDTRRVALVSSVVFCAGNVGTVYCLSAFGELLAVRAITALAAGTLNVLCLMTAAKTLNPDRVFGVCIVGQLSVGAIGLWIFPKLFVTFGISAMYACMGVLAAGTILVSRNFPTFLEKPKPMAAESLQAGDRRASGLYLQVLVVVAVFLFYIAMGGVWTFASTSGASAGLDPTATGTVMAIGTVMGIVGAALASYLAGKVARSIVLWVGYSIMVVSIAGFAIKGGAGAFAAAVFSFKFGWTFVLPFIFAASARVSSSKLFGSLSFFVGAGLAIGPLIGGFLIQLTGSAVALYWAAAGVAAVSAVMLNHIAVIGSTIDRAAQATLQQ